MIRKGTPNDLNDISLIYSSAREYMKKNGNSTQWGDTHPNNEVILNDINNNILYVLYDEDGIYGAFSLYYGIDSTYNIIYDGAWLDNSSYATIHRLASNGRRRNVLIECFNYAKGLYNHIRIDTHENNKIMQALILKHGFSYCGKIITIDDTERLAYEYISK